MIVNNNLLSELKLAVTAFNEKDSFVHVHQEQEFGVITDDDTSFIYESRIAELYSEITNLNVKFYRSVPVEHLNSIFLMRQKDEIFDNLG